jgi:omega-6 fatty acid desaturase (delta-12 desaturase)
VVVGLVVFDQWWQVLGLWLLSALVVSGLFILGHDAAHGSLFESRRLNKITGRILFLPSLHVYEAWVLGHNRIHHGHTVREGMDFVWHPLTVDQFRDLGRLARVRHRLEWSCFGAGPYYLREVWWNKMMSFTAPEKIRSVIRRDRALVLAWLVLASAAAATVAVWRGGGIVEAIWFPVKVVVIPFLGFTQMIGWTVHVHHVRPDIRWWPRREWTRWKGQIEGTTVLRMPRLLNLLFFHDIFIHVPHHVDTRIPFHQLDRATKAIEEAFPGTIIDEKFRPAQYVRATRVCKLYDFEAGTWLPYSTAATSAGAA